jgi:hypothetical protein
MPRFFKHTKIFFAMVCVVNLSAAQILAKKDGKEYKYASKKVIRNQLEKQYAKFNGALLNNDSTVSCKLIHPNSKTVMPNGQIWDAQKTCEYMTASFRQVKKTYKVLFDMDTIQVRGDTASVLIHQYWYRLQMKGGKLRDVETTADQWETWVKKNGVYLRWKVDRIVPKIWKVDGRRIDPSKPYDPNAPEYKPANG